MRRIQRKASPVAGMIPHASTPGAWVIAGGSYTLTLKNQVKDLKNQLETVLARTAHLALPNETATPSIEVTDTPTDTKKKGK